LRWKRKGWREGEGRKGDASSTRWGRGGGSELVQERDEIGYRRRNIYLVPSWSRGSRARLLSLNELGGRKGKLTFIELDPELSFDKPLDFQVDLMEVRRYTIIRHTEF